MIDTEILNQLKTTADEFLVRHLRTTTLSKDDRSEFRRQIRLAIHYQPTDFLPLTYHQSGYTFTMIKSATGYRLKLTKSKTH